MRAGKHKLLLVDDSEITLRLVAAVLTEAGYEVRTSIGVENISVALEGWRPDVILTDVDMPGMTGVQLCRRLKSLYETAHVPVVLFSARPTAELQRLAQECEADGFLCKSGLEQLPGEVAFLIDTWLF